MNLCTRRAVTTFMLYGLLIDSIQELSPIRFVNGGTATSSPREPNPRGQDLAMALEIELATYKALYAELAPQEGKYALIAGKELLGVFESHSDALTAGYKARGIRPFLVKRISTVEPVANYSRALRQPCTAPPL